MGGIVGGIAGGLMQGSAAKKAAAAQERAADKQIAYLEESRDQVRSDLAGYRQGGDLATQAYMYEMGLGPAPMIGGTAPTIETVNIPGTQNAAAAGYSRGGVQGVAPMGSGATIFDRGVTNYGAQQGAAGTAGSAQYRVNGQTFNTMEEAQAYANANLTGGTAYGGYTKTPGYDFRLTEGTNALQSGAAAAGGLYSGATMQALQNYGQDYATSMYDQHMSRLGGLVDTGMSAAQMSGNASQNAAAGVSNALAGAGNAQAAGYIGMGNGINNGIQNALGVWSYQNQLNNSGNSGGGNAGWMNLGSNLFGGNSWS